MTFATRVMKKAMQARRGFTLFEFCIVTMVVAALSANLLNRLNEVQHRAQAVAARQVLSAVQTAFHTRAARGEGRDAVLAQLAEQNPVTWLQAPPANYRGEVNEMEIATIPDDSWVFDRRDKTLLYLPPGHKSLSFSGSAMLKFKVEFPQIKDSVRQSLKIADVQIPGSTQTLARAGHE